MKQYWLRTSSPVHHCSALRPKSAPVDVSVYDLLIDAYSRADTKVATQMLQLMLESLKTSMLYT